MSEAELLKLTPKQRKQHERLRARLKARKTTYDFSRLALLAPDLRPRRKILKDLSRDWRVQTIIRVWEHLANDALPIVQRLGAPLQQTPAAGERLHLGLPPRPGFALGEVQLPPLGHSPTHRGAGGQAPYRALRAQGRKGRSPLFGPHIPLP